MNHLLFDLVDHAGFGAFRDRESDLFFGHGFVLLFRDAQELEQQRR